MASGWFCLDAFFQYLFRLVRHVGNVFVEPVVERVELDQALPIFLSLPGKRR